MEKQQGQLIRSLSLTAATILVVSSVIGSGVYKKVAPMSAELLDPSLVLWAWVLAGVISLCGALSNAEIAGMMADSGGEYVYFRRIYGKFMAYLWGWSTFAVIKTAAVSSLNPKLYSVQFHGCTSVASTGVVGTEEKNKPESDVDHEVVVMPRCVQPVKKRWVPMKKT